MADEAIRAAARDPNATPLERMRQALILARSHDGGIVFCENDEEINAAAKDGRRVTTRLYASDVILAVRINPSKYSLAEPWLGTVVSTEWDEQRWRERLKIEHEIAVVAIFDILDQQPSDEAVGSRSGLPGSAACLKWLGHGDYKITVLMRGGVIA